MPTKLIRITTVPISLKTLLKGQHHFMSKKGYEVMGVSSNGQELQDVNKEEGIDVIGLEMTRTISPIKDIKSLWNFYKLCKKEKPVIVHSHTPKAGIVGMLGAKLAGVPIRLHTVAGLPLMEATGTKRKVLDVVEKLTYSSATKVYPNSQGLYDFILQNKYTSADKLKVIGEGSSNGIDTNHFSPIQISEEQTEKLKKELNIQTEDFVFVFVGRLVGDKGINELVDAFQKLGTGNQESETLVSNHNSQLSNPKSLVSSKVPKLLLVGPLETELDPLKEETLNEIKTNPNIISVGFQKDVRPYFAISNALVFPSYREGFPNVVMQAGAMELPSIVSDINGCNEIIAEGENGTIIPVKNVEAISTAMQKLIEDKAYYLSLKNNARPMIQARYEQSVVWNALLDEYNMLIKKLDIKN
ncbi:glycosyltransferase family 4 protein [Empedobacter sp. 225-1]|uniref:glycosyltransferase family 4 protein n=1 Tax=Empedobacter sp. 225-1 TaxID=2746725 RepID=UPI0025757C6F|nr:glycosyltransferase family 4 protein [Empedobacter sp. 225-1]